MMKTLLIIIDGMDDEPIPALGNLTPDSYANMPALKHMHSMGKVSYQYTIPDGCEPATDVAMLSILGLDIKDGAFGCRSWLEALGAGIDVNPGDLCMRCNLITHNNGIIISHNGSNPPENECKTIISELNDHFAKDNLTFHCCNSFRNILVIRDSGSSVSATAPHTLIGASVDMLNIKSDNHMLEHTLNDCIVRSRSILSSHTANGISLWSPGRAARFTRKLSGAVIAGVNIVKGIGIAAGMSVMDVPGATGDENTDYTAKYRAATDALKHEDFVLLHVEAPDEAAHQRNWMKKVYILEQIDRYILMPLLHTDGPIHIIVQADHATSSLTGQHMASPVRVINYFKSN